MKSCPYPEDLQARSSPLPVFLENDFIKTSIAAVQLYSLIKRWFSGPKEKFLSVCMCRKEREKPSYSCRSGNVRRIMFYGKSIVISTYYVLVLLSVPQYYCYIVGSYFCYVSFHENFVSHVWFFCIWIEYYYISFSEVGQEIIALSRYAEFYQVISIVGRTLAFVLYFQTCKNVTVSIFSANGVFQTEANPLDESSLPPVRASTDSFDMNVKKRWK